MSLLLILTMLMSLLPISLPVLAAESKIQLIESPVHGGITTGSVIYFGQYTKSDNSKAPIQWRVMGVEDGKATLLSDKILEYTRYDGWPINGWPINVWIGSAICSYLNDGFLTTAFTTEEQGYIATYSNVQEHGYSEANTFTPNQKIVLPSVNEVKDGGTFGWNTISDKVAQNADGYRGTPIYSNFDKSWWLRSPGDGNDVAAYITSKGYVNDYGKRLDGHSGVRPALKLNLSSVIFTSVTDITAPAAIINLPNGTAKDHVALGLPATVDIKTPEGNSTLGVTWDVESCSYQPEEVTTQTFSVNGKLMLPNGAVKLQDGLSIDTTVSVTVSAALTIITTSLASEVVDEAYSQILAATGDGPIIWSIDRGTLPAGISLNSATGEISGTPTAVGISNFTVIATDGVNLPAFKALSITIKAALTITFGQYIKSDGSKAPIQWRVMGVEDGKATLLSDHILEYREYDTSLYNNKWSGSDICKYLNSEGSYTNTGFLTTAFTSTEQWHIAMYSNVQEHGLYETDTFVPNQKIVLPSVNEVKDGGTFGWNEDSHRKVENADGYKGFQDLEDSWWLRSPGGFNLYAAFVDSTGSVEDYGIDVPYSVGVRPALKLNLSSVLFASDASGTGVKTGTPNSVLNSVATTSIERKLTLIDKHDISTNPAGQNVVTAAAKGRYMPDKPTEVEIEFSGAKVGFNQYLSAMIIDNNGELKYYGAIKLLSEDKDKEGIAKVTIPEDFNDGWKLKIFTEQLNGAYKTDYASEPVEVTLRQATDPLPQVSIGDKLYFGQYKKKDESKAPILWRIMEKDLLSDKQTVTFMSEYILEYRPYDPSWDHNKWSGSDICKYLNGDFLTTAFTTEEQEYIVKYSNVQEKGYRETDTFIPNQKIVLPSVNEVKDGGTFGWNEYGHRKAENADGYRGTPNLNKAWWLRSPGVNINFAAYVYSDGSGLDNGTLVDYSLGVRPALKLNLSSVLFTSVTDITAPAAITNVANGISVEDLKSQLPTTVSVTTSDNTEDLNISWNLSTINYNPNVKAAQTFSIPGTVELPEGVVKLANGVTPNITISVTVGAAALTITTTSLSSGTVGISYSQTLAATGDSPITWSLASGALLPAGLSLDATGVISGTPTAVGTSTFTVKASSGVNPDGTQELSITINAAPIAPIAPTITTTSLASATVGATYSQILTATGDSTITWSIESDTLPSGLSLSGTTGEISGTPTTAGTSTFTVKASNGVNPDATQELSITINAESVAPVAPTITTTSLSSGTVGISYSQTLAATGDSPITWSLASGALLSAGLSLDATGVISGTPTAVGTSTFTVKASNGVNPDITKELSITIHAVPAITYTVTFDSNDGSTVAPISSITSGSTITLPTPTRSDYVFKGWFEGTTQYTNATPITKDVSLVAKWEQNTSGGGNAGGGNAGGGNSSTSTPQAAELVIDQLGTKDKEAILQNFKAHMPYTSLHTKLTLVQLKKLTNNKFTDEQLQELLDKPELLKGLGIDESMLSTSIMLTAIKNASFTDVPQTHWANGSIRIAAELGLVAGMPDSSFDPSRQLQVADTLTFLDRVLLLNGITEMKLSRGTVEKYITQKDHWAFSSMASTGSKLSETTLKAVSELGDKPFPRELLAQVLYEITEGKLEPVREEIAFGDIADSPYKEAINYCTRTGLLSGMNNSQMAPNKALTRAELIAVLIRLNEKLK